MWLRSTEEQLVFLLPDLLPGEQGLWVERADTGCRQFLFPSPLPSSWGRSGKRPGAGEGTSAGGRPLQQPWFPPKRTAAGWPPVSRPQMQ